MIASNDDDQTTEYTYDGSGPVLTLKAQLPSNTFQETRYLYEARTTRGDGVNSNDRERCVNRIFSPCRGLG